MVMNAEKLKFKNVDNDLFFKLHNIEGIIDCILIMLRQKIILKAN